MSVCLRTVVVVVLSAGIGAAWAGVPEPDVRLHGLLKLDGQPVVAGRNVALVAELASTGAEIGRFQFNDVDLTDCNRNGTPDEEEIAEGAPDVDGDGILDECNHYVLRMRMEAAVAGESNDPRAARVGERVKVSAINDDAKTCVGGDQAGAGCQNDTDCLGSEGGSNGVCTASKTLMAEMDIIETGVLHALDLGYCDFNQDGVGDLVFSRLYVRSGSSGTTDGSSWATALADLTEALEIRQCVGAFTTEIWVAAGTYKPADLLNPPDPRSACFDLPDGLKLYGGFAGTESALEERSPSANPTILSGDIGVAQSQTDNAYHVVTVNGAGAGTLLDGFIIREGRADGAGEDGRGGGIHLTDSRVTVANCTFVNNQAADGGGAYVTGGAPKFTASVFAGNTPLSGDGGAICSDNAALRMINCLVIANAKTAVLTRGSVNPALINCTIAGNAEYGLKSEEPSVPSVVNCIVWGNHHPVGQISGSATVAHGCIQGGFPGGSDIITDDPLFLNAAGGNYRLTIGSPCVNAGDNTAIEGETDVDLDGRERIVHEFVDLGAYEQQDAGSGDINGDGLVSLDDLGPFVECLWGPAMTPAPAGITTSTCLNVFDFDAEGDVDLVDFDTFVRLFELGAP